MYHRLIAISPLKIIFGIILLTFLALSCETDQAMTYSPESEISIPTKAFVGESVLFTSVNDETIDAVAWYVSDGSNYTSQDIEHVFQKAGSYHVTFQAYSNGQLHTKIAETVNVLSDKTILRTDEQTVVHEAVFFEGKIILSATQGKSETELNNLYYILNDRFEILEEVYDVEQMMSMFNGAVSFGDTILAISTTDNKGAYLLQNKSVGTINQKEGNTIISYNSGFLQSTTNSSGEFAVDYLDNNLNKLWTKSFNDEIKAADQRFVFNMNNRLFYIAFNNQTGNSFIEEFSNPSVVFSKSTIDFGELNSTISLAFSNPVEEKIYFSLYNESNNLSSIYCICKDQKLSPIASLPGNFKGVVEAVLPDGSVIIEQNNEVKRFSSDWELISESNKIDADFGISQLGDNLFILFENLSSGRVALSYLNKNLQRVHIQ